MLFTEVQSEMKFTNAGFVFSLVFLCFTVLLDTKTREIVQISHLQIRYNQAVDNAIEAGMGKLIELDSGNRRQLNKEEAVRVFFDSLAIHFEVSNNKNLKNKLIGYVPVVAVILEEGFYIYHDEISVQDGEKVLGKKFSEFYPYRYEEENIAYYFTMTDYVRMIDKNSNEKYGGDFHDLSKIFPGSFLSKEEEFDRIRRNCIVGKLTEQLSCYMTKHNKIARFYGIQYHFSLPDISKEDWYKTIDDISMVALFQGYPYGNGITGTYNRFAVAGARVHKGREEHQAK